MSAQKNPTPAGRRLPEPANTRSNRCPPVRRAPVKVQHAKTEKPEARGPVRAQSRQQLVKSKQDQVGRPVGQCAHAVEHKFAGPKPEDAEKEQEASENDAGVHAGGSGPPANGRDGSLALDDRRCGGGRRGPPGSATDGGGTGETARPDSGAPAGGRRAGGRQVAAPLRNRRPRPSLPPSAVARWTRKESPGTGTAAWARAGPPFRAGRWGPPEGPPGPGRAARTYAGMACAGAAPRRRPQRAQRASSSAFSAPQYAQSIAIQRPPAAACGRPRVHATVLAWGLLAS